jgi:uncharacterized protein YjfI (DUF2170 family)
MSIGMNEIINALNESKEQKFKISSSDDTLIIDVEGRIIPVMLVIGEFQITVVCNLFLDSELKPESRLDYFETTNMINFRLNLSSFSRVGEYHVLFGALSKDSKLKVIEEEIVTLAKNSEDALESLQKYLVLN